MPWGRGFDPGEHGLVQLGTHGIAGHQGGVAVGDFSGQLGQGGMVWALLPQISGVGAVFATEAHQGAVAVKELGGIGRLLIGQRIQVAQQVAVCQLAQGGQVLGGVGGWQGGAAGMPLRPRRLARLLQAAHQFGRGQQVYAVQGLGNLGQQVHGLRCGVLQLRGNVGQHGQYRGQNQFAGIKRWRGNRRHQGQSEQSSHNTKNCQVCMKNTRKTL